MTDKCLEAAVDYLLAEIIFRDVKHICKMHRGEFMRAGREDPCATLGAAEESKLALWEKYRHCKRRRKLG